MFRKKVCIAWLLCAAMTAVMLFGAVPAAMAADSDIDIPVDDIFGGGSSEPEDSGMIASGTWEGFQWELSAEGLLKISGSGDMPAGQAPWYEYRGRVQAVEVQQGITSIGDQAFYNCSRLSSVTLPDGLKKIGTGAFVGCAQLTQIEIPATVDKIGAAAFGACTGLTSVTLPENLSVIEERMFAQCTSLSQVTIAEGVTVIGTGAFAGCSNFRTVCYFGDATQWAQITIGEENMPLLNATRYDNADEGVRGDMDNNWEVNDADAMYLLRHTLFASRYPLTQSGDVNGDGEVNDADAMYLLRFTLFPSRYPLK